MKLLRQRFVTISAVLIGAQLFLLYSKSVLGWPDLVGNVFTGVVCCLLIASDTLTALRYLLVLLPFSFPLVSGGEALFSAWRIWSASLGFCYLVNQFRESGTRVFFWQRFKTKVLGLVAGFEHLYLLYLAIGACTLLWAPFPLLGVKLLLYLLNTYLLYVVVVNTVKNVRDIRLVLTSTLWSVAVVLFVGLLQLVLSLWIDFYYFWQGWSILLSPQLVGQSLANVLGYSNSWIQDTGHGQLLRLFGLLPDSHAFAVFGIYAQGLLLMLWPTEKNTKLWWTALVLTGFCVLLSGTRGMWVSALVPLAFFAFLNFNQTFLGARVVVRRILAVLGISIALVFISPAIFWGLGSMAQIGEATQSRALSVFNLNEPSNSGRLKIWRESATVFWHQPFGIGLGNFVTTLVPRESLPTSLSALTSSRNETYNLPQQYVTAHNLFLQVLVEVGLLGLFAFASFVLKFLHQLYSFSKSSNSAYILCLPWLMVCLWLFAYGMFDLTFLNERVLLMFFVVSGLVMANAKLVNETHK